MSKLLGLILAATILCTGCRVEVSDKGLLQFEDQVIIEYAGGSVTKEELNIFLGCTLFFNPAFIEEKNDIGFQENLSHQLIAIKTLMSSVSENSIAQARRQTNKVMAQVEESLEDNNPLFGVSNKEMMDQNGITVEDLENYTTDTMAILVETGTHVSKEKLEQRYEEYLELYSETNLTVTGSNVFVKIETPELKEKAFEKIQKAYALIKSEQGFESASKMYSDDTTKISEGKFKNLELRKLLDQTLVKAYAGAEIGKISDIIETSTGFYVFRIDERQVEPFSEFKDELRKIMAQETIVNYISNEVPGLIKYSELY